MDKIIQIFKEKRLNIYTLAFFTLTILYYEILFNIMTVRSLSVSATLYIILFSISFGLIGTILATLFNKKLINHIISGVLLAAMAFVFGVEYFVYKFFKIFYDVKTVVGGASDVVGGFGGEIISLLTAPSGIFAVILFAAPVILFVIFRNKIISDEKYTAERIVSAGGAIISFLLALLLATGNEAYSEQYNFQTAVGNFGLLTGIRLDVTNSGSDSKGFENVNIEVIPTTSATEAPTENTSENTTESTEATTEAPKEYGFNQMELELDREGPDEVEALDEYVASLTPSKQNEYTGLFKGKNLIMISAEAFSKEVIDEELTPTLYRLATKGIVFNDHYQPASAGTTGGEYQNIFGMLPTDGGMSFKNTADNLNYFRMGSQLDRLGYYGKAFHNNSYTYYSRDITHNNLGYSDGFMGYGNGMEEYVKNKWPQSDLEMIAGTLPTYIDKQPFNVYYMSVSGHSGYTRSGNSMTAKNWSRVEHLPYSDDVKGYFAANLELEDALAHLVSELEKKGIADDTVICISTDHFPYGLDEDGKLGDMPNLSELYGFNVTNLFERDHSALILWSGCLEDMEPIVINAPTFSLDIVPTLSNLFGTEFDSRLFVGRDVLSDAPAIVFDSGYDWKTEYGTYFSSKGEFVPADESIELPEDYISSVKKVVRNKMRFCEGVLTHDYFRHLFG
ncbi:MAG: sulfatase-like hydrolase/transferase [Clostridia bacterium]|nr:sulfatase-like hydrolase/transferase [Clostridia bacterium]